jgi:hypothetical protein
MLVPPPLLSLSLLKIGFESRLARASGVTEDYNPSSSSLSSPLLGAPLLAGGPHPITEDCQPHPTLSSLPPISESPNPSSQVVTLPPLPSPQVAATGSESVLLPTPIHSLPSVSK